MIQIDEAVDHLWDSVYNGGPAETREWAEKLQALIPQLLSDVLSSEGGEKNE
jgi:hypothetical protein